MSSEIAASLALYTVLGDLVPRHRLARLEGLEAKQLASRSFSTSSQ